jgi:predicted porin
LADGHGLATSSLSILHTNGAVATATVAVNNNNAATVAGRGAANGFGGRLNNVVAYVTPNWNGFAITFAHSTQGESTLAGISAKDKAWAVNPTYVNGPISLFYGWMKLSNTGAAVTTPVAGETGNNLTGQRLGGAYTFPMGLKIGLVWDKNKVDVADGTASLGALGIAATGTNIAAHARRERTAWALPIQYVTGAHKVNFTYASAGDVKTDIGTVGSSGAKMYVLGYEYSLSKRTSVAASWTSINNGNNAAYDGWHPSSNVAQGALNAGADPRILQMNLRHSF